MMLNPPRTLAELTELADRTISRRLADLGSPDLRLPSEIVGDQTMLIDALLPVESARQGCLTFAMDKKFLKTAENSDAAAVIVPPHLESSAKPCIKNPLPRLAFTVMLELAAPGPGVTAGNSDTVRYRDRSSTDIGDGTVIGDFCVIGRDVRIGRDCLIYPHVFIDDQVVIGDGCTVYPNVTIFRNTRIGRNVAIHAGCVIGDDGFGYNQVPDMQKGRLHHLKNTHVGGVVIEDFVEVGTQVCIDRGLVGDTVIGSGTKIDNLVQIAHNVKIGRDCIIVSQVGLAGHASTGDRAFLLGQAGIAPGARIGSDAIVTAQSGVSGNIPDGHALWSGSPARKSEIEYKLRATATRELPRLREFMRLFKKAESFEDLKASFFKLGDAAGAEEK